MGSLAVSGTRLVAGGRHLSRSASSESFLLVWDLEARGGGAPELVLPLRSAGGGGYADPVSRLLALPGEVWGVHGRDVVAWRRDR